MIFLFAFAWFFLSLLDLAYGCKSNIFVEPNNRCLLKYPTFTPLFSIFIQYELISVKHISHELVSLVLVIQTACAFLS
jgi:hypothetical protein